MGNRQSQTATVNHSGLGDIASLSVYADGAYLNSGNIPVSTVLPDTHTLALVAVTNKKDGNGKPYRFVLGSDANVSWICSAAEGTADVSSDGMLITSAGAQGIVTGRFEVSEGAYVTDTLTFGAPAGSGYVSVSSAFGGSAAGDGYYNAGDSVTLSASPDSGYRFTGWTLTGVSVPDPQQRTITFSMPAGGGVSARAGFSPVTNGGSRHRTRLITVSVPEGSDKEVYVPYYRNDSGAKVYVPLSVCENGKLTYADPGRTCQYEEHRLTFTDIFGHWAEDDICGCAARGLVNGVGGGKFAPESGITRAMFVTILYRLAGEPETLGANPFADVESGKWYTDAVVWAQENRIVTDYSDRMFGPEDRISREQMCTVLMRYLLWADITPVYVRSETAFGDADSISPWAAEAVKSAQKMGIVNGKPGGVFAPEAGATRAEACAVLDRMIRSLISSLAGLA